jgi:hypothetical protein
LSSAYKDHLTPEQLDKMDYRNATSFHILTDIVEMLIRDTAALYSKAVTKDAQKAIASKLVSTGYRYSAIKSGLNRLAETTQYFPSYSEIVASVRLFMPQEDTRKTSDTVYEREQEKFEKLKGEMIRLLGQEGIEKYLKWHLKHVFELPYLPEHEKFLKCAIFDWFDAGMGNDFEKIKAIGKDKLLKLQQR